MKNDELLIKALNTILAEYNACYEYVKNDTADYSKELAEEYDDTAAILEDIMEEIKGEESLSSLSEEDYAFVFELLEEYAEVFIIDHRDENLKKQNEKEFGQLMDMLERLEENYVPQVYEEDESDEDVEE